MFSIILENEGTEPKSFDFEKDEIGIGRISTSDIQLKSGNVSKQHSRIVYREGKYFVIDRKSTNGTFVNGKRVTAPISLTSGDKIFIGDFSLTFLLEDGKGKPKIPTTPPPLPDTADEFEKMIEQADKDEQADTQAPDLPDMQVATEDAPVESPIDESDDELDKVLDDALGSGEDQDTEEDARDDYRDLRMQMYLIASEFEEFGDHEEMIFYRLDDEESIEALSAKLDTLFEEQLDEDTSEALKNRLKDDLIEELLGFGPLEKYLFDENVEEIMINGPDQIVVRHHNVKEVTEYSFSCEESLQIALGRLLLPMGIMFDDECQVIEATLPMGIRVSSILSPHSSRGTSVRIVKPIEAAAKLSDLLEEGVISDDMAEYLVDAVARRKTIAITGANRKDRVDLQAALGAAIPESARPALINGDPSIQLPHEDLVVLESEAGDVMDPDVSLGMADLLDNVGRLSVDRLLVSDIREDAATELLYAINAGMDGSLFTLHGFSAADALKRLTRMMYERFDNPGQIGELISGTVDIVVAVNRYSNGQRRVSAVAEVMEGPSGYELSGRFSFEAETDDAEALEGSFKNLS